MRQFFVVFTFCMIFSVRYYFRRPFFQRIFFLEIFCSSCFFRGFFCHKYFFSLPLNTYELWLEFALNVEIVFFYFFNSKAYPKILNFDSNKKERIQIVREIFKKNHIDKKVNEVILNERKKNRFFIIYCNFISQP